MRHRVLGSAVEQPVPRKISDDDTSTRPPRQRCLRLGTTSLHGCTGYYGRLNAKHV
jgi:hypothetical protein